MNEFFSNFFNAAKGQKDLLAFAAIALLSAWLLTQKTPIDTILIYAIGLLVAWIGVRWALAKIHAAEQLRDLESRAKLQSLKVLAEHGTKSDIKAMIDEITKAQGNPDV